MRVLIVDDDRAVRDALRRALMLAGYDPLEPGDDLLVGDPLLEQHERPIRAPDAALRCERFEDRGHEWVDVPKRIAFL